MVTIDSLEIKTNSDQPPVATITQEDLKKNRIIIEDTGKSPFTPKPGTSPS